MPACYFIPALFLLLFKPQAAAMLDPITQKLTMLYEIRPGACDQSFGVHVAASAGFPADVIQQATERLAALEAGEGQVRPDILRPSFPMQLMSHYEKHCNLSSRSTSSQAALAKGQTCMHD